MTKKSRRGLPLYARRLKERMSKLAIAEGDVDNCCLDGLSLKVSQGEGFFSIVTQ